MVVFMSWMCENSLHNPRTVRVLYSSCSHQVSSQVSNFKSQIKSLSLSRKLSLKSSLYFKIANQVSKSSLYGKSPLKALSSSLTSSLKKKIVGYVIIFISHSLLKMTATELKTRSFLELVNFFPAKVN